MTRVSENSTVMSIRHSLDKSRAKLEDLQRKGTVLRRVERPSDDPASNVEALKTISMYADGEQYMRNADYALLNLSVLDSTLEHMGNLLQKVKEIAINQSSDFYSPGIRDGISNEIIQIRNELLSVANKRLGTKYMFGGHKSLERPFDARGRYFGDTGRVDIEIERDFFIPINLNGEEVFTPSAGPESLLGRLDTFIAALKSDDTKGIQNLLEKFDADMERLVALRTKVGALVRSVEHSKSSLSSSAIIQTERKGHLVDADVAELFSDIIKQQNILKASYRASETMLDQNLLDFMG